MKARRVKVDPAAPFEPALRRTLSVRLGEMDGFVGEAQDPAAVTALHDLRIAVKRVRYVLEVAEPVLPGAGRSLKVAKEVQELLGEIHDCDELLPVVEEHVMRLREEDALAAGEGRALPNRRKYRGLEAVRAHTVARRQALHAEFVAMWPKLRRKLDLLDAVAA